MADTHVWYFAFGSNMNRRTLVDSRKVHPALSLRCALPNWEFKYDYAGVPCHEPAFGNIRPRAGACVLGAAHRITHEQLAHILRTEGGGGGDAGYVPRRVVVRVLGDRDDRERLREYAREEGLAVETSEDGGVLLVDAVTLVASQDRQLVRCEFPSARYRQLVNDGARQLHLPQVYCDWLDEFAVYERTWFASLVRVLMFVMLVPFQVALLVTRYRLAGEWFAVLTWKLIHLILDALWAVFGRVPQAWVCRPDAHGKPRSNPGPFRAELVEDLIQS